MDNFVRVNYKEWDRREIFETFRNSSMYITENIDITDFITCIKKHGIRFYPAMIHCIAKVINHCPDFRYALDKDNNIGIWDVLHPNYTLPRKDAPHLFTMSVTEYRENFDEFYTAFIKDYANAEICGRLSYNVADYDNIMGVTALPGLHFSSFSFGSEIKPDFTPFTILGKYEDRQGRIILPVCGEFAHAVNDGYHITRFFDMLKDNVNEFVTRLFHP